MRAVAGTDAVMDLLVLRRRDPGAPAAVGVDRWDTVTAVPVPNESAGGPDETTVEMNRYFAEHPHWVLGTTVAGRGMYGDGELIVRADLSDPNATLGERVAAALAALVDESPLRYLPPAPTPAGLPPARRVTRLGDVEMAGERLMPLREDSFVVAKTGTIYRHVDGTLTPADVPKSARDEVQGLVGLRDATLNLLHLEASDAPGLDIEDARRILRGRYERYRHRWGPINRVRWARTGRTDPVTGEETYRRNPPRLGGFRADPDWPAVAAIEVYDEDLDVASAAAIQRERTIHPPRRYFGADTADEALAICLDETGTVNLDRVAELLGVERDRALAELGDRVFTDPATRVLVPAEEYLSGNVRAKLAEADAVADLVDQPVLLDPITRPLVEDQLAAALLRLRDRHEVRRRPPALHRLVGDPLVIEPEVPTRRRERGIQDRIFDDDLRPAHSEPQPGYATRVTKSRSVGCSRSVRLLDAEPRTGEHVAFLASALGLVTERVGELVVDWGL